MALPAKKNVARTKGGVPFAYEVERPDFIAPGNPVFRITDCDAFIDAMAEGMADMIGQPVGPKGDPRKSVLAGDWCGTGKANGR
jgi:hypothetical protein